MAVPLTEIVSALRQIAPLELAEPWDNVGLLVEVPDCDSIERCLLTIDLSERVLDEAIGSRCELIVAYHPPVFAKLERLTLASTKERIVLRAVRAGISIYSPHTALDAADGGVNDWLCDAFGAGARRGIPATAVDGATAIGRAIELADPTPLASCVARIKRHLGLEHLRVATSPAHERGGLIRSIAVCAGAGGAVLQDQRADLLWTGEMRHHDVLAALDAGSSVVLCDHTNTERGYLPVLRERLAAATGVDIKLASADREPLQVT